MSTFKEDQAAAIAAAQREANLATYRAWLATHPEVRDCIANTKMFEEYMDFTDELTPADFDFALGNLGSRLVIRKVLTPERTKTDLIEQICSLIASANNGRDGKYDKFNLKSERIKMSHWTIPQLTQRLEEIVRKQSLASKSTSELKQIVAEAHADKRKYAGFPDLDRGITTAHIKALSSFELKKLIRLHSVEQVNARLRGDD